MSKISGADLEFWWDGKEQPISEISPNVAFEEEETTSTATPGDGKDFEVMRAARSFGLVKNMYHPDGAEITTGTLVKDTKYRVTAVDTVLAAYEVGQIFVSDGTEVMSATDKVVPLGADVNGKDMDFTYDSANQPIREINYSSSFDTEDVTDSDTTGDSSETLVTRSSRESNIQCWANDAAADKLTTDPVKKDVTIDFSADNSVEGKMILKSKELPSNVNGYVPINYSGRWVGKPTETNMGFTEGEEKAFKIILKRGATTHKAYTGNAIITSKEISGTVKSIVKENYQFMINGALTESVVS